mgnify:FL=1
MDRLALNDLIEWNNNKFRKPLIVWGARQVGKTYLILELFAKQYYPDNYLYIDFKYEDEIRDFCFETANAQKIIEFISLQKDIDINENTLLIFDEVQECPNIISALKYFCQNYREIPVIATGSMVRGKLRREVSNKQFLFPVGKIDQINIFPMSFDEFLLNANHNLYKAVLNAYNDKKPLSNQIHEMALDYVYKYLLVGGMPEVVDVYLNGGSLLDSQRILKTLYENYLSDMELYQASRESIVRSRLLFENIYKELNKEAKNFSPGLLKENSKTRDYYTAINWLSMAHIINQSFQLKEHVSMPLIQENESYFRLYLNDIGMFSYQSDINAASFLSNDRENVLSGIFYENFVANELKVKGHGLFYWKGKDSAELEFIVESNNKLYPIDVKKNKGSLNSLKKFSDHNKFDFAIKVSRNNYGYNETQKLLTVPFYFVPFMANDLAKGTMTI